MSTTNTQEVIQDFDLDMLIASKTQPRTVWNQEYLKGMAETIKAQGRVQQPILVRPLPASRLEETAHMKPRPTHEIVFGECRWRSSKLAEMRSIKGFSREISDADVLTIQLIENLQRNDLSALEEGAAFQRLLDESGKTAAEIGKSVDRSRAYVYGRTKLLELCPEARDALRAGEIDASRALLVARIPNAKLQVKALKEIIEGDSWSDGGMSHRDAAEHVQRNYMLQLSKAVFKIESADLYPAAGACTTCPKRTGHDPEMYKDVGSADVCTDPQCFHDKEEAHATALVNEGKAKGRKVIAGKEALEIAIEGYNSVKFKGYSRLDHPEDSPTDQPLRKIIGALMKTQGIKPVQIIHPKCKGGSVECLPNDTKLELLKAVEKAATAAAVAAPATEADTTAKGKPAAAPAPSPKITAAVQQLVDEKAAKVEAKRMTQYEKQWRQTLVDDAWVTLRDDASLPGFTTEVHRYLAVRAAKSLQVQDAEAICRLLNLGKVSPVAAVIDFAKETPNPENLHLLIILQEGSDPQDHSYNGRIANEGMLMIARNAFGKQLDGVIKEIQGEVRAEIWPAAEKKSPAATAPLAQPEHAGGDKPKGAQAPAKKAPAARAKLSAQDALSGIAAAMQSVDRAASAPGGAVAPPEATKGKTQKPTEAESLAANRQLVGIGLAIGQKVTALFGKCKGKEGEVIKDLGEDCYQVKHKGRGVPMSYRLDQLEVVEGAAA